MRKDCFNLSFSWSPSKGIATHFPYLLCSFNKYFWVPPAGHNSPTAMNKQIFTLYWKEDKVKHKVSQKTPAKEKNKVKKGGRERRETWKSWDSGREWQLRTKGIMRLVRTVSRQTTAGGEDVRVGNLSRNKHGSLLWNVNLEHGDTIQIKKFPLDPCLWRPRGQERSPTWVDHRVNQVANPLCAWPHSQSHFSVRSMMKIWAQNKRKKWKIKVNSTKWDKHERNSNLYLFSFLNVF